MKLSAPKFVSYASLAFVVGAAASTSGCDGELLEKCGLVCNEDAFIEGSASISGIASVDAFFGAALDVEAAALDISGGLRGELDAIALSVGLEPGAGGAEIAAAVNAQFTANLEGGISIEFQPPRCEASFEVAASAAAECDVDVEPGSVSVACEGSCEAEAGVAVDCGAEAELKCTGTAPNLECSGECSGSCSLDFTAGGTCEGTCNGDCDAGCSLTDADGNCAGECTGMCTGECEVKMEGGAMCEGKCGGECTYTAPEGGCEASASASCEAMAGGSVECSGSCEGTVTEPSVSVECEATVEAKAEASIECYPPELAVTYTLSAGVAGDVDAKVAFTAWLEGFKGHLSAIIAMRAKGEILVDTTVKLTGAGQLAIEDLAATLETSTDLKVSIGGICAIANLPAAVSAITDAAGSLGGSVEASASFMGDLSI